ncbi:MAG: CoxG family protein [Vicinamibacterales bacterium]
MQLHGSYPFPAPVERVWALLMDTEAIAACLPGCRELRDLGEDRYQAELVVAVAAITGSYGAIVAIEDKVPPRSYRLIVQGTGRSGFVRGRADVVLEPGPDTTVVTVAANGDVGGAVARVGQRLIEGVGRTMMNRFFTCLQKRLETGD